MTDCEIFKGNQLYLAFDFFHKLWIQHALTIEHAPSHETKISRITSKRYLYPPIPTPFYRFVFRLFQFSVVLFLLELRVNLPTAPKRHGNTEESKEVNDQSRKWKVYITD